MIKTKIIISSLILIILSFLSYKFYFNKWLGYESIPTTFIFDEHDYPFVGYSFRQTGIPTGWSTMEIYKELDIQKENSQTIEFNGINITANQNKPSISNKNDFNYPVTAVTDVDIGKGIETIRIVQPFFDHPIFGSWLYSLETKQANSFDDLKPADYRLIALRLSIITGFLIFIFSYLLFNNLFISFVSFIIYSIVPEFILMSRFALLENILIPLSLSCFSIILALKKYKFSSKINNSLLIVAGILSGLAFLTKESGVFITITALVILIKQKTSIKKIFYYLIPIIILSLVYYGYMYYLSPDLFFKLLFHQANREWFGPLSFFYQIIQPNFSQFPKSGYWLFGLISLFTLSIKNKEKYFDLYLPFAIYLIVFLFMGGLNYSWYYLPFTPFFIIASAVLIKKITFNPNITSLILFYLLIFSSSFYWGYFVFNNQQNNYLVSRVSLLLFIFIFLIRKFKLTKFSYLIWYLFCLFIFYQIFQWNNQGFQYIISNWGNLPTNFSFPV